MIRATTPTHIFTFPENISPAQMKEIIISYEQCGKIVIEKRKADSKISGNAVQINFTQQEMNKFKAGEVKVQMRAKDLTNKVMASQMFMTRVKPVINEEVL